MLFQGWFFTRILNKKVKLPFYLLLVAYAVLLIRFSTASMIMELGVFVLSLVAWGTLICHTDVKSSLLYAALVVEVIRLSHGIVMSLLSILYPLALPVFHDMTGILFVLLGEAAQLLLTGVCYEMIYRHFSRYTSADILYLFLVLIPVLMIFILNEYVNYISYSWEYVTVSGAWEYIVSYEQTLFMQLLELGSLFCILLAHKKLQQSFRLRTDLSLLEQKEHSLNQYVEEARSHYEKTKSFRHDFRNHITVVKKLLESGKTEDAIQYIGSMEEIGSELLFPCGTNNPAVDILVGHKLGIASGMGIDVSCALLLPSPCGLRDIDVCIILANALDNAIHGCKNVDTEKYIRISGRMQGDFLMIAVENSCSGPDAFQKGIGLSNIETVAEKYQGAVLAEKADGCFSLSVLLNTSSLGQHG